MQDASPARDAEFVENVNHLLLDPEHDLVWGTQPEASTSTSVSAAPLQATPEQLAQLQALLSAVPGSAVAPPALPGLPTHLPDSMIVLFVSYFIHESQKSH